MRGIPGKDIGALGSLKSVMAETFASATAVWASLLDD